MNRERSRQHRDIGTRLAHHLRQRQGDWPTTALLQAIVADLVASRIDLALPLNDLVSRPAFRALFNRAASGSGSGMLERDALLQDLQRTFSAEVVNDLAEVLNGILDLPQGRVQLDPDPREAIQAIPSQLPALAALAPEPVAAPSRSAGRLLVVSLSTVALVAVGVVAVRTQPLCSVLNLCPAATLTSPSEAALQAATVAEQALGRATSLDAYASALEQLERELLKLSGDPLSSIQQQQRATLQAAARDARRTLAAEQADQQQLALAQEAYALASSSSGSAQDGQIHAARQALATIPPRSFAAAEASRLRSALEQLMRQPDPVTPDAPSAPGVTADTPPDGVVAPPEATLR